jgi:hypothetical protein
MPRLIPIFVATILLQYSVAAIMQWCQKRRTNTDAGDGGSFGVSDEDGTDSETCDIDKV